MGSLFQGTAEICEGCILVNHTAILDTMPALSRGETARPTNIGLHPLVLATVRVAGEVRFLKLALMRLLSPTNPLAIEVYQDRNTPSEV